MDVLLPNNLGTHRNVKATLFGEGENLILFQVDEISLDDEKAKRQVLGI